MLIKAAVTHHKGSAFKIETVILSEPKENEVLIKVVASGVCHTDAIVRDQIAPVPLPAVLGHEGSGIVEKNWIQCKDCASRGSCCPIFFLPAANARNV